MRSFLLVCVAAALLAGVVRGVEMGLPDDEAGCPGRTPPREVVSVAGWSTEAKATLLQALWKNQVVAAFFAMSGLPAPKFHQSEAFEALASPYIDYLCGRAIKIDPRGDRWDLSTYNRDVPCGRPFAAEIHQRVAATLPAGSVDGN